MRISSFQKAVNVQAEICITAEEALAAVETVFIRLKAKKWSFLHPNEVTQYILPT